MAAFTTPVLPARLSGIESARDRWRRRAAVAMQNEIPLDLVRQAYAFDMERINRGGQAMSDREAAIALRAASGRGGETGRGGPGGFMGTLLGIGENAAGDLRDIVQSLPQLPGFMVQEPKEILDPQTGIAASLGKAADALGEGNLGGAVAQVAGAPGVRLVPGSYTAEMLGGGREGDLGPGELLEHPVFTFLDLLPIASKAGVTAKATAAIQQTSPYRRAAAGLEKRGIGGAAVDVNRMVRQVQRAADEGSIGEVPIGASGKMGSINDLREYLVENWAKRFTRKELADSYAFLEQGHWAPGRSAPKWAVDSGRGDEWVRMAVDAEAMGKWWKDHGIATGELLMVGSEIFPNTPAVRKHLKNLREAAKGTDKTAKEFGSQTTKAVSEAAKANKLAVELADVEARLAGVDPIAYASSLDRLAELIAKLENPDLGVADDIATAQALLDADTAAASRFAPKTTTESVDVPWPEDLPPMRPGESGWRAGERSPEVTGDEVVVSGRGKAPTREETRLVAVTEQLDGTAVATNAAELVALREAAEANLRVISRKHQTTYKGVVGDLTEAVAREVKGALDGRLYHGTLEERVRLLHADDLAEAQGVGTEWQGMAGRATAPELAADAYRPFGPGGKTVPVLDPLTKVEKAARRKELRKIVDDDGQRLTKEEVNKQLASEGHPVSELDQRVRELKAQGYTNETIKGKPYYRMPSNLGFRKAGRERAGHSLRREQNRLAQSDKAETRPVIGTPEAAAKATTQVVEVLTSRTVRTHLERWDGDHVRAVTPERHRIDHPTEFRREGVEFPTRLTGHEKDLIRRTAGVDDFHKRVVDADGREWEVYRTSEEKIGGWSVRRLRDPEVDGPGSKFIFDEWTDDTLDTMAAVEAWTEVDLGMFNKATGEALTPESIDGFIEELSAAAATVDDAFVTIGTEHRSVAAAQVMDKAGEILPERIARGLETDGVWEPIRSLRDGVPESGYAVPGGSDTIRGLQAELDIAEAAVRREEAVASVVVEQADEVLVAADAVNRYRRLEEQLAARLREVAGGERRATFVERKRKVANPDEVRLRELYDLLDDLETTGPTHPLYTVYDDTVAAAKVLEDAGIRVAPTKAKAKAATGKKVRKKRDPGDAVALKAARARRTKSKTALDRIKRVDSAVAVSMSNLKAAVSGTALKPGPLRLAEAQARNVDFSGARESLRAAKSRMNAAGRDGMGARMVRDRAREKGHPLADTLDDLERQIDGILDSMPTTAKYGNDLRTLETKQGKITQALNRERLAKAGAATATRRVAAEMTEAQKSVAKWEANPRKALPPRLHPLYNESLAEMLAKAISDPSPEAVRALTFERLDDAAVKGGVPVKEWNAMKREAMTVVKELVESGRTPVWLPHRQVGNRGRSPTKLFGERITSPQQFKQRHLNPEPYVRNLAVAIEQNTVDHIRRLATETLYFGDEASGMTGIFEAFGKTADDLMDQYSDAIEAAHIKQPWKPKQNIAFEIIKENWTRIDPEAWGLAERWSPQSRINYTPKGKPGAEQIKVTIDEVYVPKGVNVTIEGFQKTGGLVPFRGVYDKVMDVFRVSALALSPRFLVYNAIGGLVMLLGRTDPTVMLQYQRAKKLLDDGEFPTGISKGAAMADPELTKSFSDDLARYASDRTGFLWGMQEGAWLGEAASVVRKVANKSFQVNEYFDNMYRAMAYLHESDRALAKGIPKAEAAEQGIRLANKILQDWDAMTPWERVAMRRILPFYGWMKHVLKYTFTLPFDHPLRVSVLTNFASNEMKDYRTGIPQWLSHTFFIGKEGADTKQWSINARAVNPFSDVATYTDFDAREYGSGVIAGFFTQTSPLIAAVAQSLGVDPMSGRGRLYPEVSYDPERGRLQTIAPSIIHTLPEAIIPQVAGLSGLVELTGVASVSRELRNMRVRDRDAFNGRIWTSFGMPFAPRKRSRPFEMMRAGLARDQAASEAVNSAIRSGDWSNALGYEQATIRGQTYKVRALYDLAKSNPELLEAVLSATSRQ